MGTFIFSINRFFDLLWLPLAKSNVYIDLIVISAISAWLFLWMFKKTSNQERIRFYKQKIFAHILMIRLYRDKPVLTLRSILSILGYNLKYLQFTVVPLLVIAPLLVVISIQLNNRYGYMPLGKGDRFIIRVDMDSAVTADISSPDAIDCTPSGGIILETPPLRITTKGSLFWRARVAESSTAPQAITLTLNSAKETVEKTVVTSPAKHRFSPVRRKATLSSLVLDNAEDGIPESSPFKAVGVNYKRATYPFLGWETDPIILYFIFTLILGFGFKPFMKVDF